MPDEESALKEDVAKLGRIAFLPALLDVVCVATGMGYAAVARVTDERWIAGAVRDDIQFGLGPGGELPIASTICHEIHQRRMPVIIDQVSSDAQYCNHHTPATYGFESYISFPIQLKDGSFFGTLCAIDPNAAALKTPAMIQLFTILSNLIAECLDGLQTLSGPNISKLEMYATAELKNVRSDLDSDDPRFSPANADEKMQMLSLKIKMLLRALDPQGAFLR